jgi:hypothetical protein
MERFFNNHYNNYTILGRKRIFRPAEGAR